LLLPRPLFSLYSSLFFPSLHFCTSTAIDFGNHFIFAAFIPFFQ
jgi:hypothetical protein